MWDLQEAVVYYKRQGAPSDQNALAALLREAQQENGGSVPRYILPELAQGLGVKESFLLAVIRRLPSLRLADSHCLELCGGPNCSKRAALAAFVERTWPEKDRYFQLKYVPCMRMCGKGPNIRWDGTVYNGADEALLIKLLEKKEK